MAGVSRGEVLPSEWKSPFTCYTEPLHQPPNVEWQTNGASIQAWRFGGGFVAELVNFLYCT